MATVLPGRVVRVECKRDLNASRALLVLERIILSRKASDWQPPVQFGSVATVQAGRKLLVDCKRDLNSSRTLLVLERIILKRKASK